MYVLKLYMCSVKQNIYAQLTKYYVCSYVRMYVIYMHTKITRSHMVVKKLSL